MKGIDILCASQAATAISLSMEKEEGSSSSTFLPLGSNGRTIDRYNPIIRDPRRLGIGKTIPPPPYSSSSSASSSSSSSNSNSKKTNIINELKKKKKKKNTTTATATAKAEKSSSNVRRADFDFDDHDHEKGILTTRTNFKSWRCSTKAGDFISPPGGSSRYLLSDQAKFLNVISDFDPVLKLLPADEKTSNFTTSTTTTAQVVLKNDDHQHHDHHNDEISPSPLKSNPPPPPSSSSSSSLSQDQVVVVLRVSLHCRGCERKMRKHISRMEGVSSFNIDFAAKKVTVVGNVTPLGVLNSISKVKTAQLWNPANSLPSPPTSSIKNNSAAGMMMMMKPPQSIFMQGLS